jgi:hypothetical protein
MEMMNSCSVIILFKYLVFNLEFSQGMDKLLTHEFTLYFKPIGAYA